MVANEKEKEFIYSQIICRRKYDELVEFICLQNDVNMWKGIISRVESLQMSKIFHENKPKIINKHLWCVVSAWNKSKHIKRKRTFDAHFKDGLWMIWD